MKSLAAVLAILTAGAAMATVPSPAAQAASVETSCVGYARAVTDHLRPGAPKGSPEYRAVYFPTLEECQRRGGSTKMPGGLAAAPWYLPKPAAPSANPYAPKPPAAGPSAPPAPPAAPAANPHAPTPPAAGNPPPAAGPSPAQILATGKQTIAQGLPGGMSYPVAVKSALEGCGKFAIFQANAVGANGSAKWQETASGAVNWCIQMGGAINGAFTSSPQLGLALRMIKYKTAPATAFPRNAGVAGNHACAPIAGAPGTQGCVNDQGAWLICANANCYLAEPALLAGAAATEATAVFHNCPGAQCRVPTSRPLASGQSLDAAAQARIAQCNAAAASVAAVAGPTGSPAWYQAGQSHALQCLKSSQPPIVGVAASKKLQLTKGRECAIGEDGRTYCVDDNGALCVVQPNGSCERYVEGGTITVTPAPPPGEVSNGTNDFYSKPGGAGVVPPTTSDPRHLPAPPPVVIRDPAPDMTEPEYQRCAQENPDRGDDWIRACFIERCVQAISSHPLMAGATEEQKIDACVRAYDRHKRNLRQRVMREIEKVFEKVPPGIVAFFESPGGEWLGFIAGTGVVAAGVLGVLAVGPVVLVAGGATVGAAVLIGIGAGSAGGGITGKTYGPIGDQACRPHMQRLIQQAGPPPTLDASNLRAVEDFLTELCALNLPGIEQVRAMQRGSYQACADQARAAQPVNGAPPIVAVSRALNNCLRQTAAQASDKALLARSEGTRFADQWSALLRDCSASWGLQWRGTLAEGAAWPMAGTPGGDHLASVSACVLGSIR